MARKAKGERILVRLPQDVKRWIAEEAEKNCASQNSEIVRSIRSRMDSEEAKAAAR